MGHTDGIIDNALNSWLNVHNARLAAQPAGFVPLATNDFDLSNVAVIEDDGTLLYASGASTLMDQIAVVEKFYQTHNDIYDFLCLFSAVALGDGSIFKLAHSLTTGITTDAEDNRDVLNDGGGAASFHVATGVIRNLKAATKYVDLTTLPVNPAQLIPGNNDTTLSLIAQEIGHYWGMASPFETVPGGAISNALQGRGASHWSFFMHSQASSMEGNSWVDNGGVPNSFTSIGATNNYSPFDLYLMGFLDPALTPNTFYVGAPSADTVTGTVYNAGSTPTAGANITGTRVNVGVGQLQGALGLRNPDFNGSQKDFKVGFILVVANGATLPANAAALNAAVNQVNGYRTAWGPYWNTATGGASTMDTTLGTARNVDLYVRDNLGDDGTTPNSGSLSRSPDIIIRKTLVANPPVAFGDPTADPGSDKVEIGNDNYVYVRVHNRGDYPADADIDVYYAALTTSIDPATWVLIGSTTVSTVVPGNMAVSDAVVWPNVPDPGGAGHFCLIAMISDPLDPAPDTSVVTDVVTYLDFVRNNNNVAYRNVTFEDVLPDADGDAEFVVGSFKKASKANLIFDGSKLPRGFTVRIDLPAQWRRLRLRKKGFEEPHGSDKSLRLRAGRKAVLEGVPVGARSKNRIRVRIDAPKNARHGVHAALAVVHKVEKRTVGRVEFGVTVVAREKTRYLGVRRTKFFYPAADNRVAKLANNKLRPFDSPAVALQWGFDPAPGFLVGQLGPKVVSAGLATRILKYLNGARSATTLTAKVRRPLGASGKAFSENIAKALLKERSRLRSFQSLDEVAASPRMNSGAFVALVDCFKTS